jgi:hypothetical protein
VLPTIAGTDTIVFEFAVGTSASTFVVICETTVTSASSGLLWGHLESLTLGDTAYRLGVFPYGWRIRAKKTGTSAMDLSFFCSQQLYPDGMVSALTWS